MSGNAAETFVGGESFFEGENLAVVISPAGAVKREISRFDFTGFLGDDDFGFGFVGQAYFIFGNLNGTVIAGTKISVRH